MSASAALLTRSWPVGTRICTLTVPKLKPGGVLHVTTEWSPTDPERLTTIEVRQYRLGRNRALAEIADELGIAVAVLEV